MTSTLTRTEFDITLSQTAPGRNLPQRIGGKLWLPMLAMALMAFPVGIVLAAVKANTIASGGSETTIAAYGHLVSAANFLGFAAVFAAISFAIAKILGELRAGGGTIQQEVGSDVETLKMIPTAKAFLGLMAVAMMTILAAVAIHAVVAAKLFDGSANALAHTEQWALWLEGARRFGVALYLMAITLGLSTIIYVLRFQGIRLRELSSDPQH